MLFLLGMCCAVSHGADLESAHVKAGGTKVAGSVELGSSVSSNPAQAVSAPFAGVALHLEPALHVQRDRPTSLVTLDARYALRKYLNGGATAYDRYTDFDLSTRVSTGLELPLGLELRHRSGMQADPFGGYSSQSNTLHLHNDIDVRGVARVQTLRLHAGGTFDHDSFASPDGSRDLQLAPGAVAGIKWMTLPRTAVVLEGSWNEVMKSGSSGGASGRHLRVLGGLRGRKTERTTGTLTAGYGVGLYGEGNISGLNGILVEAGVRHEVDDRRAFSLSYRKDFETVFFTSAAAYHSVEARLSSSHGARWTSELVVDPRYQIYRGAVGRNDLLLRAEGNVDYELRSGIRLHGQLSYRQRASTGANVSFTDVGGQIGVRALY